MQFDIEYIEKLAKVLNDNSLTEISIEDKDQAVTIRKDNIVAPAIAVNSTSNEVSAPKTPDVKKGIPITSPMVGTFYRASSKDSEPYVEVGQTISKGDVVCVIEAMKLMNEIESEISGKVVEICVADGQPVEFGQVLMYVE